MNRVIWKFLLPLAGHVDVTMPKDSWLIRVGVKSNEVFMWAIVQPDAPPETRHFDVFATGQRLPEELDECSWLATVDIEPNLVLHIFENDQMKGDMPC